MKNQLKKLTKTSNGITLIALVVTIIVLLILAGVSISMLSGDNGLLKKAGQARDDTIIGEEREQVELAYISAAVKKLGDDVTYSELQEELDANFGDTGKTDETKKKTKVTRNANNTLNVLFRDTQHNFNVNNGKVAKVDDASGSNNVATGDLEILKEFYIGNKYDDVAGNQNINEKSAEWIFDDEQNERGYQYIAYNKNLYKVTYERSYVNDGDWWYWENAIDVVLVNIDLNSFGEREVVTGHTILVTPSTQDHLIHGNYNGPRTFTNMYYYDENTGELDTTRPFTNGYVTHDNDLYDRYYDTSGALVPVAHRAF